MGSSNEGREMTDATQASNHAGPDTGGYPWAISH